MLSAYKDRIFNSFFQIFGLFFNKTAADMVVCGCDDVGN
jgi:hypothetical protein